MLSPVFVLPPVAVPAADTSHAVAFFCSPPVWFAAWAKSLPESSHLVHGWRDVVVYSSLLRHAQVPLWQAAAAIVVTTAVTAWVLLHTTGSARAKHAVHKLEQLQCAIKDKEKEVCVVCACMCV